MWSCQKWVRDKIASLRVGRVERGGWERQDGLHEGGELSEMEERQDGLPECGEGGVVVLCQHAIPVVIQDGDGLDRSVQIYSV